MVTCPLCTAETFDFLPDGIRVIKDGYPVTPGHLLFVPDDHDETHVRVGDLLKAAHDYASTMGIPSYNIGVNVGPAAGQTVPHIHVHLIPRTKGDCLDPTGGVRNVISGKGNYRVED